MSKRKMNGMRGVMARLDAVTKKKKVELALLAQLQAKGTKKEEEVKQTNEGETK